ALADRQAELIFVDDHGGAAELEAEGDLGDLGGLEGVLDQDLGGFVPADDVDFLAAQFVNDVLDAAAADADARADGVDFTVDGGDGDLGAVSGLAGQGFDLDRAFADFRDFAFKQPPDKLGVASGEDDFDGGGCVADFEDEG